MPLLPNGQNEYIVMLQARALAVFRANNPGVAEQGVRGGTDASTLQLRRLGQTPQYQQTPTGRVDYKSCCDSSD